MRIPQKVWLWTKGYVWSIGQCRAPGSLILYLLEPWPLSAKKA